MDTYIQNRKEAAAIFWHIMRNECLENLILTEYIEKRESESQQAN